MVDASVPEEDEEEAKKRMDALLLVRFHAKICQGLDLLPVGWLVAMPRENAVQLVASAVLSKKKNGGPPTVGNCS